MDFKERWTPAYEVLLYSFSLRRIKAGKVAGSLKGGNFIYPMMLRGKFLSSFHGGKSVRGFRVRFSTT